LSGWTDARLRLTEVFAADVVGESCFSSLTIINAASRALSVLAVFDEPDGGMREPPGSVVLGLS
jgi:hypothetical protein